MSTYFVCRSPYYGPSGKYLKRFPDATVLDWFRNHWRADPDGPAGPDNLLVRWCLGS